MTRFATSRRHAWTLLAALLLVPWGVLGAATEPEAPPVEAAAAEADTDEGTGTAPVVAYVKLEGPIDDLQYDYMKRAIEAAEERGADTVVVHIESPGGTVYHSELISNLMLVDEPRMVVYVDNNAWSGGALVAYSAEAIYMTPKAKIGDIGVVTQTADGQLERPDVGDKANSPVRAHFQVILDKRHWPYALFMKMTDWDREVYRVILPDGSEQYVIDRDGRLAEFKREHPDIPEERYELVYKKDELISFGAARAVEVGMATGIVEDLDDLYTKLGVDRADVIDLAPTRAELLARSLRGWASLLLGLAILFVVFEMKTPGVGIWAILAVCCGVGFVVCQYSLHFTNNLEVVALFLGLAMIGVDLWFGLTGGVMALAGGLVFIGATLAAFMPDSSGWDWTAPGWSDAFGRALMYAGITVCIMLVGLGVLIAALPHLPWIRRLSVQGVSGEVAGAADAGGAGERRILRVATDLHPGGSVEVDGVERSARSEYGDHIPAGTRVEVVDERMGEYIVRAAPDDDPAGGPADGAAPEEPGT